MEKLIGSDSTVAKLWKSVTLRNPRVGGDMFSETSVLTRENLYNYQ
jgi:hypothetical protein